MRTHLEQCDIVMGDQGVTEAVLAILERARLHRTFFVIGRKCGGPQGQGLIHAVHQARHRVGNHTLTYTVAFGDRPEAAYARYIAA